MNNFQDNNKSQIEIISLAQIYTKISNSTKFYVKNE